MYEHGPLWKIEQGTKATPEMFEDDTVDYPWHAWLSSEFGDYKIPHQVRPGSSEQSFDIWMSFRFPPSAFQF
ncbi:hypothetical protein QCA50_016132 [Cerrena zonata]|uniref:Aldos-2-ulose dehydratase/isomerase (AUDH) Cupin domain-containing protein n=1 Tax=Cerrena zonata TaxID=2478898 RepID=A0AAW0FNF9_9APHY